jgi:signal recognition particle subunit SRP54
MRLSCFIPDQMASRILGMGDVLADRKAQSSRDRRRMQKRRPAIRSREDRAQLGQVNRLGSLTRFWGYCQGPEAQGGWKGNTGAEMKRVTAMIDSMTFGRRDHAVINGSRKRIARGSGTNVQEWSVD